VNIFNKTVKFIKEVRQELSKVAWSTRKELIGSTVVVITSTFFVAIYIGVIDLFLSRLLTLLFR